MAAANLDLLIEQGKTFTRVLRWATDPLVYKPITAATQGAPVTVTAAAHGLSTGQRAAVQSVVGMTQLNAANNPPRVQDYHTVTVVDVNTVKLNGVNGAGYAPYVSGGFLVFQSPVPLTGYTARMSIKDQIGGTELIRLDTTNSRIALDMTANTITLLVDATTTAGLTWTAGVYDLELVSAGGVVTALIQGNVTVTPEVTTT